MSGAVSSGRRPPAGPEWPRLPPSIPRPAPNCARSSITRAPLSRPATGNCRTRSRLALPRTWPVLPCATSGGSVRAVDVMLGRRQVYANQCFGLHYPFLPADEFFDREHFPWLAELESQTDAIRAEVVALLASDDPGLLALCHDAAGHAGATVDRARQSRAHGARCTCGGTASVSTRPARAPRRRPRWSRRFRSRTCRARAPTVFFSILRPAKHIRRTPASPTRARSSTCR